MCDKDVPINFSHVTLLNVPLIIGRTTSSHKLRELVTIRVPEAIKF